MNIIACTSDCIYQQNGCCSLERAGSQGISGGESGCVYFVPKRNQKSQAVFKKTINSGPADENGTLF